MNSDPHGDPFDTIEKRTAVILDLFQGTDPQTFIDSSNLYIHFIDAVYALDPSARFILSVRHGKDFVRSALSRGWHSRSLYGNVPQRGDDYFGRWAGMDPLERNAWIWVHRNKKALEGLSKVTEAQKLIVKIEEIEQLLPLIENFSGVEIKDKRKAVGKQNENPSFDFPPREEWTSDMNRRFDAIAGGMMKVFNYG